jgi:exosortase sorting signal-containing protein
MQKKLSAILALFLLISLPVIAANAPPPSGKLPSATAAGALTLVSATTSPSLANQIVASQSITGTTNDGSGDLVCATIWDDGTPKVSQCLSVPVGTTATLTWTLNWTGSILTGAPGVGLYVVDATSAATPTTGGQISFIDPITPSQFTSASTPVPTMSEWALIVMALIVAAFGVVYVRRRSNSPPAA